MVTLKSKRIAITLLILAGAISGINTPVIRYGLKTIPTPLFGFLRLTIPLVVLTPLMLLRKQKRLKPKEAMQAMLFGLFIYVAANGLFYLGVKRSGAVNAAVIGLLEPLLMFTFSVEVMKERFNARILGGIVIAFSGSILVVFGPLITHEHLSFKSSVVGNLLLAAGALCSISGTWVAKIGLKHIDKLQLLFWSLIPGTVIYGLLSIRQWGNIPAILHHPRTLYAVLFGAIFNGLFAYLFCFYALKRLKGEEYGVFEYVNPAVAAIVAVFFFGENFTPLLLLGVGIIFTGLYLAETHRHKVAHWHFLRSR